jgi:hypothetical protein
MTRSGPSLSQSHDVKTLGCRFRPCFTERSGGLRALSLYWDDTCQRGVVSQAGKGSPLAEAQRAATLRVGEALRHDLEVPRHLPPEISSLLPHNDTRMIPSDTLVANAV